MIEPGADDGARPCSALRHVAIFQIRSMRFGFCFTRVFVPKPVPTFGRHALQARPCQAAASVRWGNFQFGRTKWQV